MRNIFVLALAMFAVVAKAQDVKVMSYNIRLDVASDGENRWDNRKDMLAGQVLFFEPDFMGVQEALPHQMQYLDSALVKYDHIGVGREDGKNKGEFSAIFYNKSKYTMLENHTFWLSETPDVPSKGWDAAYNRVCTYGLFENNKTKQRIWIFNTHFDHVGNVARTNSVKMITDKIKEVNKDNLPFAVTGDFNLEENTESIKLMSSLLNDSKKVAKMVFGPDGTFNAFEFHKPVTTRIDYIFVPQKRVKVVKYAVLSDSKDCRYPSDHLPVYVELKVK
ncbi:endonuclease/exonuclease/phosphatase family protein [Flavobacterium beibuense]|uniref:endonuclease/exonuclease/phosphatase family protein n=1 Tax=Flavobacterium beibuense TaxID=657326 RepID=UPI003A9150EE